MTTAQLTHMEMDVCDANTANNLGITLTSFLHGLDSNKEKAAPQSTTTLPSSHPDENIPHYSGNIVPPTPEGYALAYQAPPSHKTLSASDRSGGSGSGSGATHNNVRSDAPSNHMNVDLSAKSYSTKKQNELKTIFASSNNTRHVSEIIASMNERGIGGINLKGTVQVEAFIRKQAKEKGLEESSPEFIAMMDKALEESFHHVGDEMEDVGGDDGGMMMIGEGENGQEIMDDSMSENATAGGQRREGSGRGGRGGSQQQRGVNNPYVVQPSSAATGPHLDVSSETYLKQNFQSSRGIVRRDSEGRQRQENATNNDHNSALGTASADVYETPHNRIVNSGDAMEYHDNLNSHAYHMNASKNASFRKMGSTGKTNTKTHQQDLNEHVDNMAEKQRHVRGLGNASETYTSISEKDAGTMEYERKLQDQLNDNKKGRTNIQPPTSSSSRRGGSAAAGASNTTRSSSNGVPSGAPTYNDDNADNAAVSNESNRQASATSSKINANIVHSTNDDEYLARKKAQANAEVGGDEGEVEVAVMAQGGEEEDMDISNEMNVTDGAVILGGVELGNVELVGVGNDEPPDTIDVPYNGDDDDERTRSNVIQGKEAQDPENEEGGDEEVEVSEEVPVVEEEVEVSEEVPVVEEVAADEPVIGETENDIIEVELEPKNDVEKRTTAKSSTSVNNDKKKTHADPADLMEGTQAGGCCTCSCVIS